jgi:RNA polymerase sigma-70 factor (ECF subfamily)
MGSVAGTVDRDLEGVVASAAAGDDVAFARIVAAHHDDMRRVCVVVAGSQTIAEEAVAAAWGIAWRKLGSLRDPARLRPWLVSVAVNETRQALRRGRRRSRLEVGPGPADRPASLDPSLTDSAIDLRVALGRMDPDDRALLAMRYVAGFDATELAAATGLTPSGVRSRLERLLARLRRELSDG